MEAPVIAESSGTRTRAEPPRPGLDRPLAKEARDRLAFAGAPDFGTELWFEERVVRFGLPRPWQRVVSHDEQVQEVVFERFIGITLADVLDCTRRHGSLLPLDAWVPLALEVLEAFDGLPPEGLRWGLESSGVGWSLSGELVLSLTRLNSVLRGVDAVRVSRPHQFALLSPEQVSAQPLTRASVASTGLSVVLQLLCGVGPFHRASNLDEVRAINSGAPTLPSALHPEANAALDEVARRAAAAHPRRWATPAEVCSALRSELRGVERAAAVRALFALCEDPLRQALALARRDKAWLPEAWEGVFPRCDDPAAALAVMEDRLSEVLPPLAGFPRARQFAPPSK